jgi:hypothetical protein
LLKEYDPDLVVIEQLVGKEKLIPTLNERLEQTWKELSLQSMEEYKKILALLWKRPNE